MQYAPAHSHIYLCMCTTLRIRSWHVSRPSKQSRRTRICCYHGTPLKHFRFLCVSISIRDGHKDLPEVHLLKSTFADPVKLPGREGVTTLPLLGDCTTCFRRSCDRISQSNDDVQHTWTISTVCHCISSTFTPVFLNVQAYII